MDRRAFICSSLAALAAPLAALSGSPVESGLVASLARPGGNITGIATVRSEVVGKQLELLKEIVPRISSLTVLWNSANLDNRRQWKELEPAAVSLGLKLHSIEVHRPAEIEKA